MGDPSVAAVHPISAERTFQQVHEMYKRHHRRGRAAELAERWRLLVGRDGPHCDLCGAGYPTEFDHVIPKPRGGDDSLANMVLAHEFCNKIKGEADHGRARTLLTLDRQDCEDAAVSWPPHQHRWREWTGKANMRQLKVTPVATENMDAAWQPSGANEAWHLTYPDGSLVGKAQWVDGNQFLASYVDEYGRDRLVHVAESFRSARTLIWQYVDYSRARPT